jgi:CelD/BcsL family acetyltransferase involved in cellulose biosynthesis
LHTIAVYTSNEQLQAIACFYCIDGVLYFNGCTEETDYLDLIVRPEDAQTAWTAVFDCLCSPQFPNWTALDLCNVPEASPTRQILSRIAQQRGFLFQESVHEVCPVIKLPESFEAYIESMDKKQRHELRRKLRRAEGEGVTLKVVSAADDLAHEVDEFLRLLQKSTPQKREWLNNGRRAVFHEAAKAALTAGTLQLLFVEVEGQKAATLFNFDYKDRVWVYNSGLDPESFSSLSVGVVVTAKAIELAIKNGRKIFDFLRGNEEYKYRFGAVDTKIYRLQVKRD